jgi:hypothetical protein
LAPVLLALEVLLLLLLLPQAARPLRPPPTPTTAPAAPATFKKSRLLSLWSSLMPPPYEVWQPFATRPAQEESTVRASYDPTGLSACRRILDLAS